ncbi:MAG: Glucose-1-phosphate thymidylyltransferase 1 [Chlamydiia bacterium]|nr:Glucose-1-phosphate thymidylyltransferase 1 [Chlamydiia bacterium]
MSKKGIILSGGTGTRLFPLTKAVSKQLLPVYDKPMIYYPLSILMKAGISEVLIISTPDDMPKFKKLLGDGTRLGMEITYTIQENPSGIGEAFILAEDFIGKDPVALILGDNIFHGSSMDKLLIDPQLDGPGATVFAIEVDAPEKYGVVHKDSSGKVIKLLEKPKNPPTNLAVTGLYFYDNKVVDIAKTLKPSARGEYEITDINNVYLERGELSVSVFEKGVTWFDAGGFDALYKAATFVKDEQNSTGNMVGAIELVAYQNGWISKQDLDDMCIHYHNSGYGGKIACSLL